MAADEFSVTYLIVYDDADQVLTVFRRYPPSVAAELSLLTIYGSGLSVTPCFITTHVTWT